MSHRSISLLCATAIVAFSLSFATTISGSDPQPADDSLAQAGSQLEREAALKDISRIREQLGGSVLKGSILEPAGKNQLIFDTGLRSELGLPLQTSPSVATRSKSEMIKSLRTHCAKLDEIANHIETLREYEHADALRESAADLRLMARQMDSHETGVRTPASLKPNAAPAK